MTGADLESLVVRFGPAVERALARALPEGGSGARGRLHQAKRNTLDARGKRLRPVLCFASCEAVGGEAAVPRAEAPAGALELVHTYSLIHDDLPCMDDDDFRRGRPSNHRVYGEALAVLAGDGLLTRAFGVLGEAEDLPAATRVAMVAVLAEAAGSAGMVGGQAADVEAEGREGVDLPTLQFIHTHKTGALFGAACRLGGLAAGADPDPLRRLGRLGEKLGLMFQIADDLLDETGRSEDLGKTSGRDRARGKATYPRVLGLAESRDAVEQLAGQAAGLAETFGSGGEALGGLVRFVADRAR
jgi:geranylgeranyl diphosphate synthase type II